MRITLEALAEHEGIADAGTTSGEVLASGGSRSCLYSAMRKGWVNTYSKNEGFYTQERTVPRYYRTDAGTAALKGGQS
jgi:hypothetical protein